MQNVYKIKKKLAKVLNKKFPPRLAIVYILWYNEYVEFSVCKYMCACCKRYAKKRKVAVGRTGNFRGVCPILKPGEWDIGHSL